MLGAMLPQQRGRSRCDVREGESVRDHAVALALSLTLSLSLCPSPPGMGGACCRAGTSLPSLHRPHHHIGTDGDAAERLGDRGDSWCCEVPASS